MPNEVVTYNAELLLVAHPNREHRDRIVPSCGIHINNANLVCSPLGKAYIKAKKKHSLFTKHKNSMKRILIDKALFQPEKIKVFQL